MELTPRVGDRVIVRKGSGSPHRTLAGTVQAIDGKYVWVVRDGFTQSFGYDKCAIEVVDREPAEWPEGWDRHSNYEAGVYLDDAGWYFTKDHLEYILATGPDMLARWDELMGES